MVVMHLSPRTDDVVKLTQLCWRSIRPVNGPSQAFYVSPLPSSPNCQAQTSSRFSSEACFSSAFGVFSGSATAASPDLFGISHPLCFARIASFKLLVRGLLAELGECLVSWMPLSFMQWYLARYAEEVRGNVNLENGSQFYSPKFGWSS